MRDNETDPAGHASKPTDGIGDERTRLTRAAALADGTVWEDADLFARQNDWTVYTFDAEDLERASAYAQHHAGGLYVLLRDVRLPDGTNGYAKVHDSWGDPEAAHRDRVHRHRCMCGKGFTGEDGPVVLHMYSHEGYDEVRSFTDGRHALRALEDMPDAED